MRKRLLSLQHETWPGHQAVWYWIEENNTIHAESLCPGETPSLREIDFTPFEALRQYALLTSPVEGWAVRKDFGWHQWVENQKEPKEEEVIVDDTCYACLMPITIDRPGRRCHLKDFNVYHTGKCWGNHLGTCTEED